MDHDIDICSMKYGIWNMPLTFWCNYFQTLLCLLRAVLSNRQHKPFILLKRKINQTNILEKTSWARPHNSELNCIILIVRTHKSQMERVLLLKRVRSGLSMWTKWLYGPAETRCLVGTQELEQKPACLSFVIQHVTLSSSSPSLRHASCCFRPWCGPPGDMQMVTVGLDTICLLYTSDAADE